MNEAYNIDCMEIPDTYYAISKSGERLTGVFLMGEVIDAHLTEKR